MKIGIMGIGEKAVKTNAAEHVRLLLRAWGYDTVYFASVKDIDGVKAVVILGGDGAILHAAVEAAKKDIKIIAVNYGTLGFLTEYEKEETEKLEELLFALREGSCSVLKRTMLEVRMDGQAYYGLNEVVLQRDYTYCNTQIAKVDVYVNGREMDTVSGDGLLICTPTGSTAYSLSAGGAILTPDVPAFMLTPICAFSLNTRPVVFSDRDEFEIVVKRGGAMLLVDGRQTAPVAEGARVIVRKAPFTADFPMRENAGFFRKIRRKLSQ